VLAGEVATGPEVLEELRLCGGLLEVLLARREGAPAGAARRLGGGPLPADFVVGTSAAARELLAALEAIAPGDLPVLIRGETGVGKELVARAVHALSPRRGGPFVALNCAALPTDLLEAELFGIAAGVATGVRARHGRIRQAHGGTLFLDEIGDMQAPLQARLLRVLQEGELLPVGGAPERVDFRCLAATHGALEGAIAAGRFRADLYFRLAGAVLRVPSLRERREDLPLLIEHFLRRFGARRGKRLRGLTARALDLLLRHPWPGNVRELEHEVQRLVELCPDGGVIDSALLDPRFEGRSGTCGQGEEPTTLRAQLAGVERRLIEEALAACSGSQRQAALRLGISRNTLARRLRELGIPPRPDPPAQRRSSEDP
jgi:transcriptional regulator with PAS, ATPase and Fis domain